MSGETGLEHAFLKYFGHPAKVLVSAPGRVNLLGEHIDYNDGIVMPAAIDRHVKVAAAAVPGNVVSLQALDLQQSVSFSLTSLEEKKDVQGKPLPSWAKYPAGVTWSLQKEGFNLTGMQAVYSSSVPIGSGLSSSAAVQVAFAATWRALGGWQLDNLRLAQLCLRAEVEYVGLICGLMDQFASACGVEGHTLVFDTRSLEWRPVELPPGSAIVVADSGVRRSLANSAYNERHASCEEAVALLSKYKPGLKSLRDISTVEFAAYSEYLPQVVRKRAEHVVQEIYRVKRGVNVLEAGNAIMFGGIMFAGHRSLRDLYEVSTPELDALVEIAHDLPGIYGARLTGAGFGGCTVNLIEAQLAEAFIHGLIEGYRKRTGKEAKVYLCQASNGVRAINLTEGRV
jgi:galactokinase